MARARAGKLRRIGTRPVKVDVTYIDNAADAHLLAADRLDVGSPVAGKAYFISNGEPVDLWEFIDRVLAEAGLPPVTRRVSAWKARLAGRVLEWVYRLFRLPGEPPMTRFVATQTVHVALVRHLGRAARPRVRAEGVGRGGAAAARRAPPGGFLITFLQHFDKSCQRRLHLRLLRVMVIVRAANCSTKCALRRRDV